MACKWSGLLKPDRKLRSSGGWFSSRFPVYLLIRISENSLYGLGSKWWVCGNRTKISQSSHRNVFTV